MVNVLHLSVIFLCYAELIYTAAVPAVETNRGFFDTPLIRPLLIKAYPGIDDIQSDLYEVYMEPFNYVS